VNTPVIVGPQTHLHHRSAADRGFTLIELMVAMALFLIVAGAAFSLFNQHVQMATRQQNYSSVNIALRNAMSQLEVDLSGAGQNLVSTDTRAQGENFTLGVIIHNNFAGVATACAVNTTSWSYPISSACFDSFTTVNLKPCTAAGGTTAPVLQLNDPGGATEYLASAANVYGNDTAQPTVSSVATNDASCFQSGDEILVVQVPTQSDSFVSCDTGNFSYCMGVVTLTANATTSLQSGTYYIKLPHTAAGSSNDPLQIVYASGGITNFANALNVGSAAPSGYASGIGTFIMDLGTAANNNIVSYAVMANPSNAADPQLVRCPGSTCTAANAQVVADQVIGFKVGADIWGSQQGNTAEIGNYIYNAAHYCSNAMVASVGPPVTYVDCTQTPPSAYDPYDYTLVRSVRISLIGRTTPAIDNQMAAFQNGFDGGPYLVQQAAVVVDVRNLSDLDSTN
jgi:prepilin-type N-terminal cleavage/methylation domain-containing protein